MRVGFLADSFLPTVGGAETMLDGLATRLTQRGDHVTVMAPYIRGRNNCLNVPYCLKRFSRPSSKHFGVRQLLIPLAWHHWRHQFDVLHCNSSYPSAFLGTTLKSWTNLPVVVRPHGDDILPNQRICRHPKLAARVRKSLCSANAIVAQGQFLRSALLNIGVPDRLIHVIHNGVDLDRFAEGEPFPHPRPYILALGNLFRRKGFDVLLEALARTRRSGIDLLIAGDGPEREPLTALAAELKVSDRVYFLRHVSGQKKIDLLRSALFLVVPSRCEPFANVVLEGLAAGLPVVASEVDGNPEMVIPGRNGTLFPNENVEALAAELQRLMESPIERDRLRQEVPETVQRFDWSQITQQYESLYRSVIREARHTGIWEERKAA
ncbi:glycosyltransferase family 4 protein [Schlesneria sp. T3-172]|uniref:glycosyltransferase family 4 protein n=1 Tax=Schlesneria TaxID=656899 RepID=UPI002EFAF161